MRVKCFLIPSKMVTTCGAYATAPILSIWPPSSSQPWLCSYVSRIRPRQSCIAPVPFLVSPIVAESPLQRKRSSIWYSFSLRDDHTPEGNLALSIDYWQGTFSLLAAGVQIGVQLPDSLPEVTLIHRVVPLEHHHRFMPRDRHDAKVINPGAPGIRHKGMPQIAKGGVWDANFPAGPREG